MGIEVEEFTEEEYYEHFGKSCCVGCGSHDIQIYEREKSGNKYIVYVCNYCHSVIKREFK